MATVMLLCIQCRFRRGNLTGLIRELLLDRCQFSSQPFDVPLRVAEFEPQAEDAFTFVVPLFPCVGHE